MAKKWSRNTQIKCPKCSFSKEAQQNGGQEMVIEHGFSKNLRDRSNIRIRYLGG